jgi:LPXTG-motif cell wall-anchored protein
LEENSLKITVANAKGYVLPDTGGTGTYGYTITGSILLFLALVAFSIDTWRRRQTCREGGKRTEKGPHDKVTCQ